MKFVLPTTFVKWILSITLTYNLYFLIMLFRNTLDCLSLLVRVDFLTTSIYTLFFWFVISIALSVSALGFLFLYFFVCWQILCYVVTFTVQAAAQKHCKTALTSVCNLGKRWRKRRLPLTTHIYSSVSPQNTRQFYLLHF